MVAPVVDCLATVALASAVATAAMQDWLAMVVPVVPESPLIFLPP
jgi:hypothetical protein